MDWNKIENLIIELLLKQKLVQNGLVDLKGIDKTLKMVDLYVHPDAPRDELNELQNKIREFVHPSLVTAIFEMKRGNPLMERLLYEA